jgi:hypothetical protein
LFDLLMPHSKVHGSVTEAQNSKNSRSCKGGVEWRVKDKLRKREEEAEIYCVSQDFVVRWNMKIQNKTKIN